MRARLCLVVLIAIASALGWYLLGSRLPVDAPLGSKSAPRAAESPPAAPEAPEPRAIPASSAPSVTRTPQPSLSSPDVTPDAYVLTIQVVDKATHQPLRNYELAWTQEYVPVASTQKAEIASEERPPMPTWSGMPDEAKWAPCRTPNGVFELRLPSLPAYLAIAARSDEHTPDVAILSAKTIASGHVSIRLGPRGHIEGQVVYGNGTPVVGVRVTATAKNQYVPRNILQLEDTTDGRGHFRFEKVYSVVTLETAEQYGFSPVKTQTHVSPGGTEHITLVLRQEAVVEGVVTLDGQPLPDAEIVCDAAKDKEALTDRRGRYRLQVFPRNSVRVTCRNDMLVLEKTALVEPGMVTEVDFHFTSALGAVTGNVTLDGSPLAKEAFVLYASYATPTASGEANVVKRDGGYEVTGLQPGRVALTVECTLFRKSTITDVVRVFGKPTRYALGLDPGHPQYNEANLPPSYAAIYDQAIAFVVYMVNGRARGVRCHGSIVHNCRLYRDKLGLRSTLADVIDVVGPPKSIVEGEQMPRFIADGVLYKNVNHEDGHCYYNRSDLGVSFEFQQDRVSALTLAEPKMPIPAARGRRP